MIIPIQLPGIEPGYGVDPSGVVWSCLVPNGPGKRKVSETWKPLTPFYNNKGYPMVTLSNRKKYLVHRLVLLVLKGPCPEGWESRHLDGDQGNPKLENLTWGTRSQNNYEDKKKTGTFLEGSKHGNSKLTEDQVEEMRALKGKETLAVLSERYGVAPSTISRIQNLIRRKGGRAL